MSVVAIGLESNERDVGHGNQVIRCHVERGVDFCPSFGIKSTGQWLRKPSHSLPCWVEGGLTLVPCLVHGSCPEGSEGKFHTKVHARFEMTCVPDTFCYLLSMPVNGQASTYLV